MPECKLRCHELVTAALKTTPCRTLVILIRSKHFTPKHKHTLALGIIKMIYSLEQNAFIAVRCYRNGTLNSAEWS